MIQKINELLQNAQLQQQVKEATNLAEAIKLIATASVQKGYSFTQGSVARAISELMLGDHELSEDDLLSVAGGLRCMESCIETQVGGGGPVGHPTFIFPC